MQPTPTTSSSRKRKSKSPPLFSHYFFLFVPNLLFSARAASHLLSRIRHFSGDGVVLSNGEAGVQSANAQYLHLTTQSQHVFLVAHPNLLRKYAHLTEIPIRPDRWLTDSIAKRNVQSSEAYDFATPTTTRHLSVSVSAQTLHTSGEKAVMEEKEATTTTPHQSQKGKRLFSMSGVHMLTTTPRPSKRRRLSAPIPETRVTPSKALFTTPTRVQDVAQSVCVSGEEEEVVVGEDKTPVRSHNWACETRTYGKSRFPMNDRICKLLGILQEHFAMKKDRFRASGYQKAISKIRGLQFEVLTLDDARAAGKERAIGPRIEQKLVEIITTGRLVQAGAVLQDPHFAAVKTFCNIWGVGPVKAMNLVSRGCTSIQDVRKAVERDRFLLDKNQKIGLRLYEDLLARIPRHVVAELELYTRKVVREIDPALDITVAGSYLRGKSSCGDVDIMIHGPTERVFNSFDVIKRKMRADGILTDDLVEGPDKYFGVFKFPGGKHGRIDLFPVPQEEYPFALLTYTGSAIFNRSMRAKARALGYCLSQHSLQKVNRFKGHNVPSEPPILVESEKEIFALLDIPYVPPAARSM